MFTWKNLVVLENVLLRSEKKLLWIDQVPFLLLNVLIRCISEFKMSNFQWKFPFKLKMFELEFKEIHCQFIQSHSMLQKCHFKVKKFTFESNELKFFYLQFSITNFIDYTIAPNITRRNTQFMIDHTIDCYLIQTIFCAVSTCFFKFSHFTLAFSVQKSIIRMRNAI